MSTYQKLITSFLLASYLVVAQKDPNLVAKYTFNNNDGKDEVGQNNAKIYNALPSTDRFGNSGYAYYLQGHIHSFINLGTCNTLKPIYGTLSLWVKINTVTYNGKGVPGNPIIITKSNNESDFNEAFCIGFNFNLNHITVATSLSELHQAYIHPDKTTSLREWHHAVITYDDDFLCYYLDGVMEGKVPKNFRSRFLPGDSVLVGVCFDKKNIRALCGVVDDIEIYNRVLSYEEILNLYSAPNPNTTNSILKWVVVVIGFIFLAIIFIILIKRHIKRLLERENEEGRLRVQWYEQENKVLKAQMNPHFIFNSLNTIQQFIILNDNKTAQLYLSKFSRLLRKILETNTADKITLQEEIDLCEKYLEIESLRFNNVFYYNLRVSEGTHPAKIHIPHFMIQVFLENAIWHGLLPKKEGVKRLDIAFEMLNADMLLVTIDDNGVGRKLTEPDEKGNYKKSLAIGFIQQRLLLYSKIKKHDYTLSIIDKQNNEGQNEGTCVLLKIPILND